MERGFLVAVPFLDLKRQYAQIKDEIDIAIKEVVDSAHFILGPNVSALEEKMAAFCGTKYGVGVASGTDALHLALLACGVGAGDEVITSPFTFVATADAIAYTGAKPVFVDIDPETYNIDPKKIEEKITKKTKAIMPVHLYGQPADMKAIMDIAKKHNLKVVEDAAQAIGAEYDGKKACSIGDAGCLSFFPTKNLGCFGDGGMVLTNSKDVYEKVKMLRGHGSKVTYHYDMIGFNSRLDALQAAIIRVKLKHINKWNDARIKNAEMYNELFKGSKDIVPAFVAPKTKSVFNQYTIRIKKRDELFAFLEKKGIGRMVYYPLSLHLQKAFAYLGGKAGDLPASESAEKEVLSLPIFPELKEEEIKEVAEAVLSFFK